MSYVSRVYFVATLGLCNGPHSVCGVCFSLNLNKSTSYLYFVSHWILSVMRHQEPELHFHAKSFQSCPTLATPWTAARQAHLSMGFSRQEYWSGVPLRSPWTKLVEVMEFQLTYFKSWKMMLWKCCTQHASKFGRLSSGHKTGKCQFSFQSQRKAMPKNAQTTAQLHSSHTLAK